MDILIEAETILKGSYSMDLDKEIADKKESYQKLVEELNQINQRRQEIANGLLRLEGAVKALEDLKKQES